MRIVYASRVCLIHNPQDNLTIVDGGIVGAFEAYFAYLYSHKAGKQVRITIHEKK